MTQTENEQVKEPAREMSISELFEKLIRYRGKIAAGLKVINTPGYAPLPGQSSREIAPFALVTKRPETPGGWSTPITGIHYTFSSVIDIIVSHQTILSTFFQEMKVKNETNEQVKEPAREISTVGELMKLAVEMSSKSDPETSAEEILFELAKLAEYGGSVGGQINAEIIEFSDDERNKLNRYINKIPH